jgi:hypothetical protein
VLFYFTLATIKNYNQSNEKVFVETTYTAWKRGEDSNQYTKKKPAGYLVAWLNIKLCDCTNYFLNEITMNWLTFLTNISLAHLLYIYSILLKSDIKHNKPIHSRKLWKFPPIKLCHDDVTSNEGHSRVNYIDFNILTQDFFFFIIKGSWESLLLDGKRNGLFSAIS